MITVQVRLNGALAERLGARRGVALADGATVADLRAALSASAALPPSVAVSVGGRIVGDEEPLTDGAEVAVLLPVAGGA